MLPQDIAVWKEHHIEEWLETVKMAHLFGILKQEGITSGITLKNLRHKAVFSISMKGQNWLFVQELDKLLNGSIPVVPPPEQQPEQAQGQLQPQTTADEIDDDEFHLPSISEGNQTSERPSANDDSESVQYQTRVEPCGHN